MQRWFLFLFSLLAALPALAAELAVSDIVQRSAAVAQADFEAVPEFNYTDKDTVRKLDSKGDVQSVSSSTYEVTMIGGTPYKRLVAVEGEPLSPDQQDKEQRKMRSAIARRKAESPDERASRIAKFHRSLKEDQALLMEMTRAFNFELSGEENLDGHAVYVLAATPRPGYRPPIEKAKCLTGMAGRLWIDKETYHWVKVVAQVIHPVSFGLFLAHVEPGTRIVLEQMPVEGAVWQAKKLEVRVSANILHWFGHNSDEEDDYSGYQRCTE